MWKHPNYYKKLRASLVKKSDQAISGAEATAEVERSPGPGPKPQATSSKQQAVDLKINLERVRKQYTSSKHQASSAKFIEE